MSRPAQNVVFVLVLAIGAWLTFVSVSSAVQTYRHRGGGMVHYENKSEYADAEAYRRHNYTSSAFGLFIGGVILWLAFQRPYDARSGCGSPMC